MYLLELILIIAFVSSLLFRWYVYKKRPINSWNHEWDENYNINIVSIILYIAFGAVFIIWALMKVIMFLGPIKVF